MKNGEEELARKEFSVPAKKQLRQPLDKLKNAPPEPKKEEKAPRGQEAGRQKDRGQETTGPRSSCPEIKGKRRKTGAPNCLKFATKKTVPGKAGASDADEGTGGSPNGAATHHAAQRILVGDGFV